MLDQVIKKERGKTSSNIPRASSLPNFLNKNDMTKIPTNHQDGFHHFHPKKNIWIDSAFHPPAENIRKWSLWKKNAVFFTASGCFPPSPGAKKKTEFPGNGTCAGALGRGWLFPELFLGAWKKSAKVEKLHGNLGKHPAPKPCSFIARLSNIDHFSWIQMNHMNRNNWLWHHAVHGSAKQNKSFKNNLLPSFSFQVTWTKKRVAPL